VLPIIPSWWGGGISPSPRTPPFSVLYGPRGFDPKFRPSGLALVSPQILNQIYSTVCGQLCSLGSELQICDRRAFCAGKIQIEVSKRSKRGVNIKSIFSVIFVNFGPTFHKMGIFLNSGVSSSTVWKISALRSCFQLKLLLFETPTFGREAITWYFRTTYSSLKCGRHANSSLTEMFPQSPHAGVT